METKLGYSPNTIKLIQHFEGLHDGDLKKIGLQPKRCPAGIWTAGWGRALTDPKTGKFLKSDADYSLALKLVEGGLTENEATEWLIEDINEFASSLEKSLSPCDLNPDQIGAVLSLAYNIGTSSFLKSTLMSCLKTNNLKQAALEFLKWDKATVNGKKVALKGLTLRRQAEKKLFETGNFP